MKGSPYLLSYLPRGQELPRITLKEVEALLLGNVSLMPDALLKGGGEAMPIQQGNELFNKVASRFKASGKTRILEICLGDDTEIWSLLFRQDLLNYLLIGYEENYSVQDIRATRLATILDSANHPDGIDVVYDPRKDHYQGKKGCLYFHLKKVEQKNGPFKFVPNKL